ncbi:MAG: hypothetical protein Q9227_004288 [Pyrenula ochraceoflavens]
MPLPSDDQVVETGQALVDQFQAIFGKHAGFRPDSNSDPRGIAARFHLGTDAASHRRIHTDIIAHSTPFFPTRTGADFLSLLRAIATGPEAAADFLSSHPSAAAFVNAPKPTPSSFAREQYWGVTAFKLTNARPR